LQQALRRVYQGFFTKGANIKPYGNTPPSLMIQQEQDGGRKIVKVTGRQARSDGLALLLPEIPGLQHGDRITVTGSVGENIPEGREWGMCLRNSTGEYNQVAQALAPKDVFSLSYMLDKADLKYPLYIHSNSWGSSKPLMDFYVDSISITRHEQQISERKDIRQLIYSMETDDFMASFRSGERLTIDPDSPIIPSGSPTCTVRRYGRTNVIHVTGRTNDWDGIDIRLDMLGLMPGNSYNVHVVGRTEGEVPDDAEIMFQIIPGYAWRDNHKIVPYHDFTLGHILTLMELETADTIRITTNTAGAKVDFAIYSIEITTEDWMPFLF
jgi:hypothetical protein